MEMKKILVSFIQDRSGSMASVWNETLNGFKTYVTDLQKDQLKDNEVEYLFSLTTFDTQIETPYLGVPIAKARLCRVSPGENYACSAGFFFSERRKRGKGTEPKFKQAPIDHRCGVKW
jgi:hypothetical protein